ncbi:MAG: YiiD C-terminal domain-containing protein [Stenotrophobium sp.]
MTPDEITEYLHRNIPLTRALGVRVLRCETACAEISAPLAPNLNHRGTAFGGSLATLGIVSGWTLLHFALQREGIEARLVIQNSNCDFMEPAAGELTAVTRMPAAEWDRFLAALRRGRRARICVKTEIMAVDRQVVTHEGTYVALP